MNLRAPLLLLLAACAGPGSAADDPAPVPYTAEAIRDAHPAGTLVVFRVQAAGQPSVLQRMLFQPGPTEGTTDYESTMVSEAGEPLGAPTTSTATWEELRDHARFPAGSATRVEDAVEVAVGRFDCWCYTVAEADEFGPKTTRYWFAKAKPGPPVRLEVERAGELELSMEMLEYRRP